MFGFFRKSAEVRMMEKQYKELIAEAHKLMQTDRYKSDAIYMEAVALKEKINELEAAN